MSGTDLVPELFSDKGGRAKAVAATGYLTVNPGARLVVHRLRARRPRPLCRLAYGLGERMF